MRIAVMGAGAMGSVYAARLARAGHHVLAIARRRDHVEAINAHGLRLVGPDGEFSAPVRAFVSPPAETVDLVVLAVKAADAASAAAQVAPLMGEHTVVLTIQNGLGSADEVAKVVDPDQVAVGIASGFGASLPAPGEVHHNAMKAMRFGPHAGLAPERVEAVALAWRQAGFDALAVEDLPTLQWQKLVCNGAYSAICAITGWTVGEVLADATLGPVSVQAGVEAHRVAVALGIEMGEVPPEQMVRDFAAQMPAAKPSALLDHLAGRASEVALINGSVCRLGATVGVPTPVNQTLTALVLAREAAF